MHRQAAGGEAIRNRRLSATGLGLALLIALGLVALLGALQLSSAPSFCGSCHVMQPYYDSWKSSTHDQVPCVDCHIPPGVTAEFRKKYEALAMVARYFTGTYGTNPRTEIDDASCLRCHEKRLLFGKELYRGILFDHAPHLTEMRRGKKLRCTSCHSQIVQGSHITVTSSTCVLCHFKNQQLNRGTSRCVLCHQVPQTVIERAGFRFNHADVVRFAMSCEGCHAGSVRGDGAVPRERCLTCHNEPQRLSKFGELDLVHRKHVAEHKVDCTNCHLEIQHGLQAELEVAAPACNTCHGEGHSPQQQLYAGLGGRGVESLPSRMYLAGIRCQGCHLDLPGRSSTTHRADEISCMSCHGPRYRKIYTRLKTAVDERTRALGALIRESEVLFRRDPPEAFRDALYNLRLMELGHGIHNVPYSLRLLDKALSQLNQARRTAGASPLRPPWPTAPYASSCFACHPGVERQVVRVFQRRFAHADHVARAGIDCLRCHLSHEERTGQLNLRFGPEGCASCHHRERVDNCQVCHDELLSRTVVTERGEFSHQLHLEELDLNCTDCHQHRPDFSFARSREICSDCHE